MANTVDIYTADDKLENPRITYHPQPSSVNNISVDDDGSVDMEAYMMEQQDEINALQRVAGCQDVSTLTTLTMTVDTSELSISRIGEHMANLVELKLNHSNIVSVRDLGTGLKNLQVLWLSRVGLQRLDGISAMPSLRELYASFNHISTLEAVQGIDDLEVIDLEGNCIADLKEIDMLGLCSRLETVSLEGNPVSLQPEYRTYVVKAVPHMKLLDDVPVSGDGGGLLAQDPDEVQGEEAIVSCAVRSARVGFDSHEFDEVEVAIAEGLEVRPGTAGLRVSLSSLRPSTTGQLASRRGDTGSLMSARPSSAYRPQSASAHSAMQRTARPVSGGLQGAMRSMTTAGGLFWRKHRVGTSGIGDDDNSTEDGGSELTRGSGGNALMGGGAAAALRRRKNKPPSPLQGSVGLPGAHGSSLRQSIGNQEMNIEQLLAELRAWKISATEVALKEQDVARAPLISSSDEEEESLLISDDDEVNTGTNLLMLGESDSENESDQKSRDREGSSVSLVRAEGPGVPSSGKASIGDPGSGLTAPRRSKHRVAVETARTYAASDVAGLNTGEILPPRDTTLSSSPDISRQSVLMKEASRPTSSRLISQQRSLSRTSSVLSANSAASGLLSSEGSFELGQSDNGVCS